MKRQIIIEGDIARIPLTQGYQAVIDAADVHLVANWNWAVLRVRGAVYAKRNTKMGGKPVTVLLHRAIFDADESVHVDHRDGDGLNCRRSNLRPATQAQNCLNTRLRSDNRTGFKGVYRDPRYDTFVASICTGGVREFLGSFKSAEEAHAAYCKANAEQHKEFGRTA